MYDKERLIELLKRDALQTGDFTLSSGRKSPYYLDVRKVTLSSEGAALVAYGIMALLKSRSVHIDAIGGPTIGADPIVGATLAIADEDSVLDGFIVRTNPKTHGTCNLIEGLLQPSSTVAIVDDVATTGESLLRAVDVVEMANCRVAIVIVIVDRLEGAREAIESRGLTFRSLTTIEDLVEV